MNYTTVPIRLLQTAVNYKQHAVIPSGCHSNMQYLHMSLINKYVLLCVTSSPASERGHSPKSLSDAAQCGACSPCNIACVYCATHPNPLTQYQPPPTVCHTMHTDTLVHMYRHICCTHSSTPTTQTHTHTQSAHHKQYSTYASINVCNKGGQRHHPYDFDGQVAVLMHPVLQFAVAIAMVITLGLL